MFRAIKRFFKAVAYVITYGVNKITDRWSNSPAAISSAYENIKNQQEKSITQVKKAVGGIMLLQDQQEARYKSLSNDVERYSRLLECAQSTGRTVVEKLKSEGLTEEEIGRNPEFLRCANAYKEFQFTLQSKQENMDALAKDIEESQKHIEEHTVELQKMVQALGSIEQEKQETIVELELHKHKEEVNNLLLGISTTDISAERARLQRLRKEAKVQTVINQKMLGASPKSIEEEFLEYADQDDSLDEFKNLMGFEPNESLQLETKKPCQITCKTFQIDEDETAPLEVEAFK